MKDNPVVPVTSILDRIGIPGELKWAFAGVLIFMVGNGIELGWLSPYLLERGLTIEQSAALFTVNGIIVALSSWFSGVMTESFGPRKTMLSGLILFILSTIGFVHLGIRDLDYGVMLITYALRGFGYPLFAYSFLVWIAYKSPAEKLSSAMGWFWFIFTAGFNVIATYYSIWAIKNLGYINTLWSALVWVIPGGILAIVINQASFPQNKKGNKWNELLTGLTIIKKEPKVLMGGIVRIVDTASQFAFPVYLPMYMAEYGIDTTQWLKMLGIIFGINIFFNLLFGYVGDRLGWRRTIIWFGGVGSALTTLLFYYSPQISGGNYFFVTLSGVLWGAGLAGYVPLSALVPSLVKTEKGAAMSVLNLGAGLAVFIGPAIVGLFISMLGSAGVTWIFALLYLASAVLTHFMKIKPEYSEETK
jgi:polyol permease family